MDSASCLNYSYGTSDNAKFAGSDIYRGERQPEYEKSEASEAGVSADFPWTYNSGRHDTATEAAAAVLSTKASYRGATWRFPGGYLIPGGAQDGSGSRGFADIAAVLTAQSQIFLWEVKGTVSSNNKRLTTAGSEAKDAIRRYVGAGNDSSPLGGPSFLRGEKMNAVVTVPYDGPYGMEMLTVFDGPTDGTILYTSAP